MPNFNLMKRPLLHVLFWTIYLVQESFLHFVWMAPALGKYSEMEQIQMAVLTGLSALPPKFFIVYYFIFIGVPKLIREKKRWLVLLPELLLVFVVSMVWFRATFHYFVFPYIYHLPNAAAMLDIRNIFIAILGIGYVTGIAIALSLLRLQVLSREREQGLVKEKLQTELKFLKNQTNPHFLFNTLNNIYALTRKKSDQAPEVVMKLSELLSFMLYESGKESIAVSEEIKILEDYIDLEKIRYNERLSIHFNKEIDNPAQPIAPLLFLPIVENAFKHGVSETRFDSFIHIKMKLERARLRFQIENTAEDSGKRNGNGNIGLTNTKRQLELMYGEHSIDVRTVDNVFSVDIIINLDSYGKI